MLEGETTGARTIAACIAAPTRGRVCEYVGMWEGYGMRDAGYVNRGI